MEFDLRPARADDRPFLITMLTAAFHWRGMPPADEAVDVMQQPEVAHYVENWPREGDLGVVARAGNPIGFEPVGVNGGSVTMLLRLTALSGCRSASC